MWEIYHMNNIMLTQTLKFRLRKITQPRMLNSKMIGKENLKSTVTTIYLD